MRREAFNLKVVNNPLQQAQRALVRRRASLRGHIAVTSSRLFLFMRIARRVIRRNRGH
jgi:hypothetical protein